MEEKGLAFPAAGTFVVIVLIVAASFAVESRYTGPSNGTIQTCTNIPAISFLYCGSPQRISAYGTPGATPTGGSTTEGSWNFTATINSTSVRAGGTILLSASLTNIGPNVTIRDFVQPYFNPYVNSSGGKQVWALDPLVATWANFAIAAGETLSQEVDVPTGGLQPGQTYFLTVAPLSIPFPTPNNLTFTFRFQVY